MAMMGRILGFGRAAEQIGGAVGSVAEVFVGNRAEREAGDLERHVRALEQFGSEFTTVTSGRFDRFVNGLNRLPRPVMTLGTLGLFVHAMVDPASFSGRMAGLAQVPDQLWWLLGVIVSFYFGARELHHRRAQQLAPLVTATPARSPVEKPAPVAGPAPASKPDAVPTEAPAPTIVTTNPVATPPPRPAPVTAVVDALPVPAFDATDPDFNAALAEWRRDAG